MRVDLLNAVADVVDATPAERFDMGEWASGNGCGTVACAVGNALLAGVLPDLRLGRYDCGEDGCVAWPIHSGTGSTGYLACADQFDISPGEATWLFAPIAYPTDPSPEVVSARIRSFVAGGRPQRQGLY